MVESYWALVGEDFLDVDRQIQWTIFRICTEKADGGVGHHIDATGV